MLLLLSVLVFQSSVLAQDISFIYINGSNNNDKKMHDWFLNGVQSLHARMKKQIDKNIQMQEMFLNSGSDSINETPIPFFWGDKSKNDLEFLKSHLGFSKSHVPTLAYSVRTLLAEYLHDAIWVQKSHNIRAILTDLNNTIKTEASKGNKTVLFGYSAGSFVTYQYLFNRLPYINFQNLLITNKANDDFIQFVKDNPRKNTCISALEQGQLGVVTMNGTLIFDKNSERLKQNYLKIDDVTNLVCTPEDSIKGVVNMATPLVLFFSDLTDKNYQLSYYNLLMLKYLIEKDMFFLCVNFSEDPLGFPTFKNNTNYEFSKIVDLDYKNSKGFVYDSSHVWSRRSFALAHTSYWTARNVFPNAVIKAFIEGYTFQNYPEVQLKMLEKRKKKYGY